MTRLELSDVGYAIALDRGPATGRAPVLLLHGFTGRGGDWAPFVDELARTRRVVAPDLLGHGDSSRPTDPARYALDRQARDLAQVLDGLGARGWVVVGYSYGARVALQLALDHPEHVAALVLASPSGGIADAAERAARRAHDEELADVLERDGMTAFVRRWRDQPVFLTEQRLPQADREALDRQRQDNDPMALAAALRGAGQGAMAPLFARLSGLRAPVAMLVGAMDAPGAARARAIASSLPGATLDELPDTGHAPHREAPGATRAWLAAAIDRTEDRPRDHPMQEASMPTISWTSVTEYSDIRYEHSGTGIARVTIDRPEVRNAFRPETVSQLIDAFARIRDDASIGCVLLTGAGDQAFCAGGDLRVKGHGGYVGGDGIARLNVLDLQRQIRSLPVPVIALVNGFAIGGGQVLHVVCDLSIASEDAIFGQVGPRVGSFDAGFGIGLLARLVGDKKAKEMWFLCRRYTAAQALDMGLVNAVVPLERLEAEGVAWAEEILAMSPTAIRFLKSAFLVATDGLAGLQEFAGNATGLYYTTEEAHEGSRAFLERRPPDFDRFPRRP